MDSPLAFIDKSLEFPMPENTREIRKNIARNQYGHQRIFQYLYKICYCMNDR